jgi:putative transposase
MSIQGLCAVLGMSRQNYYKVRKSRQCKALKEDIILAEVRQERQLQSRLGGRKLLCRLAGPLAQVGINLGRDRFFGLLRREGLLVKRRRRRAQTTDSRHGFKVYRNRLKGRILTGPHQAWVSDITYLRTEEGFMYLSLVTDGWSRMIVGYDSSDSLEARGVMRATRQALAQLPAGRHPLHHSDRGSQYCCREQVKLLQRHQITISMTEENHCYENGMAERVNGILKDEYGLEACFKSKVEALAAVREAVRLYNECRPHQNLGYDYPAAAHGRGVIVGVAPVHPVAKHRRRGGRVKFCHKFFVENPGRWWALQHRSQKISGNRKLI